MALDVFRGITITAMILVNNPGSWQHIYSPLAHAKWHGWTLTDLIFPFFVFIIGLSIAMSVDKQKLEGSTVNDVLKKGATRSLKLFLLGLFLALFYYNLSAEDYNWFEQRLLQVRFMGVLQRIALVYFVALWLWLLLSEKQIIKTLFALLIGYWLALSFIPYQDSNGNQYQGFFDFGNNLSAWLDAQIFRPQNMYYQEASPFAFDPEGVLSTLPAVATALSGIIAGQWLKNNTISPLTKTKGLLVVGVLSVICGEFWGQWFPINKALWTSSYVLLSTGYGCLVLAVLIYLLDIKKIELWSAPFVVFGNNSIAFFMFAGILGRLLIMLPVGQVSLKTWLYTRVYQPAWGDLNGSLAFAISFLIVSYVAMYLMYRKRIFWKV